jgi:membrane dipeptidase
MKTRREFLAQSALAAAAFTPVSALSADVPGTALLDRARALLDKAPLIDTHNDLPSMFLELNGGDVSKFDLGQRQPALCADVPALREGRVGAQYWSIFVESATQKTHVSMHEALREFDVALRIIASQKDFEQARTADDIERIRRSGRIACLMGVSSTRSVRDISRSRTGTTSTGPMPPPTGPNTSASPIWAGSWYAR